MENNNNNNYQQSEEKQSHDQPPQRIPLTRSDRYVSSDLFLAISLQDQERAFASLETIESETESEEVEENENGLEDYEYFEPDLGFIDDEDYSEDDDEEMDGEDELDVDDLTYEELIALGDFIGVEDRGLSVKEISSCLKPIVCKTTPSSFNNSMRENDVVIDRCVVCQVEYKEGEGLVAIRCGHLYHSDCITKWLQIKKCCPICSFEVSSTSTSLDRVDRKE